MKVVHYVPFIDKTQGGVSACIAILTRDLGKLCELHIITHRSKNDYELDNCKVYYIQETWKPWNSCKRQFVHLLKEIKPDVFHTNGCWTPLRALTLIWAHQYGVKTVLTPHGMLDPYALHHNYWLKKFPAILLYQKKAVRMADVIHTTADMEKENLLRLGWNDRITLIPNCVRADSIELKSSWAKNNRIVFISRIHHKKGIHFLIEAAAIIKSKLEGYEILIAGPKENSYYDEMVEKTKQMDVAHIVKFVGPIYDEQKWKLYQEADVFILPTITENFGIVIAEALASGTPVITSEGAPWQDLNTYKCGWWTSVGTQGTVEAILDFLKCSESDLEIMGRNGRNLILSKYSSQSVAREFIRMYEKI